LKVHTPQFDWLLTGEPFVQYRTLVDLLDKKVTDRHVQSVKKAIRNHRLIRSIFKKRNKSGFWGSADEIFKWWPKKDSTFWVLGVLADFGFSKQDKDVVPACEYVFSKQMTSGAFGWAPPPTPGDCFTGILAESLSNLGYVDDPRLKKAYAWLARRQRLDGGFWCKATGQPGKPRQAEPSCAYATLCTLGALALHPTYKNSVVAEKALEFLLTCWDKRGKIKYAGHDSHIGSGWEKLKYPHTDYRILKFLDIIAQFDSARTDPRVQSMIDMLVSKQDKDGRYRAESIHKAWSGFDFAQKEKPSRWITFIVYYILKRMNA